MTKANDSVLVTPGSGATVATHLVDSKEHQVVMIANANGHLQDTLPTWYIWSTYDARAANEILIDLFNATGSGVILKVRKLFIQQVDPEETRPGAALMGGINWIPEGPNIQEITLREDEGMRVQQITSSTVGVWGWLLVVTVE